MTVSEDEIRRVRAEAECLHDRPAVEAAFDRMAAAIRTRLEGSNPLVLCVMTGALIPAGHLLTRLDFPLQVDYLHATRYRHRTQGGTLEWKARPQLPLTGRHVLVIDDILDEGHTLAAILAYCREAGASSVSSAVLVDKRRPRDHDLRPDFVGLEIEDRYVFGYGMDYKGYLRNAAGIYAVKGS